MTDKRMDTLIGILRELSKIDPERIPIYSYEDMQKVENKNNFTFFIMGIIIGALFAIVVSIILQVNYR